MATIERKEETTAIHCLRAYVRLYYASDKSLEALIDSVQLQQDQAVAKVIYEMEQESPTLSRSRPKRNPNVESQVGPSLSSIQDASLAATRMHTPLTTTNTWQVTSCTYHDQSGHVKVRDPHEKLRYVVVDIANVNIIHQPFPYLYFSFSSSLVPFFQKKVGLCAIATIGGVRKFYSPFGREKDRIITDNQGVVKVKFCLHQTAKVPSDFTTARSLRLVFDFGRNSVITVSDPKIVFDVRKIKSIVY